MLPLFAIVLSLSAASGPKPDHAKLVAECRKACDLRSGCQESCHQQTGRVRDCKRLCDFQKDRCRSDCDKTMPSPKPGKQAP